MMLMLRCMSSRALFLVGMLMVVPAIKGELEVPNESEVLFVTKNNTVHDVYEGNDVVLDCEIEQQNPTDYVTIWSKLPLGVLFIGESNFLLHEKMTRLQNGSLHIKDISKDLAGQYTCQANTHILPNTIFHIVRLPGKPSVKINPMGDFLTIKEGENFKLTCEVDSFPRANVTWTFLNDTNWRGNHNSNHLHFKPAKIRDAGTYRCTATNEYGSYSEEKTIRVAAKPKVYTMLTWLGGKGSLVAELGCIIYSQKPVNKAWTRSNGDKMKSSANVELKEVGNNFTMILRGVMTRDFDNYTCTATNEDGNATSVQEVNGLPVKPSVKTDELVNATSARVEIFSTSPFDLKNYVIKIRSHKEDEWDHVHVPPRTKQYGAFSTKDRTEHMLTGLQPNTNYDIQVIAENDYGSSESDVITFRTNIGHHVRPAMTTPQVDTDETTYILDPNTSEIIGNSASGFITLSFEEHKKLRALGFLTVILLSFFSW